MLALTVAHAGGEGLCAPSRHEPALVSTARHWLGACALLASLLLASPSWAAPVPYLVTGGSVQVLVFVGGFLVGQTSSPGLSGNLTIDSASQSLDDINLVLDSNISLSLSSPYGGYDEITIESASITSDIGFSSTLLSNTPQSFTVSAGSLTVNGSWGAADSLGVNPTVSGLAISYAVPLMTAVITSVPLVNTTLVTLNALDGTSYGELFDLTVLASFAVTGVTIIPEPSTALLAGLGLALLAARARRIRRGA
jgi:hypothetical protein